MKTKERIFHSLAFEALALILIISFASLFLEHDLSVISGVSIALSLIAMIWNYVFNVGFDKIYGNVRINRGIKLRVLHGLLFEAGLLISTIPILMWALKVNFWQALTMDLVIAAFFLVYAIAFNWLYDVIRFKLLHTQSEST